MKVFHKEKRKVKGLLYVLDFFNMLLVICLILLIMIQRHENFMPLVIFVLFELVFSILSIGLWIVSMRLHKRIHDIVQLYDALTIASKKRIEQELSAHQGKDSFFGISCLYVRAGLGRMVIPYQEIVWYFPYETSIGITESRIDGLLWNRQSIEDGIVIFLKNGVQLRMHTKDSTSACEYLGKMAPHAIYGYTKERYRIAKKDISYFLSYLQDIDFNMEKKTSIKGNPWEDMDL